MRGGAARLVGVDTATPNRLVAEALAAGALAPFAAYSRVRPEVAYGERSRVDFLLDGDGLPPLYLEVKNCHLMRDDGLAEFPDCIAARSARHLDELSAMVRAGARARARHGGADGGRALLAGRRHRPRLRRRLRPRPRRRRRDPRLRLPGDAGGDRGGGGDSDRLRLNWSAVQSIVKVVFQNGGASMEIAVTDAKAQLTELVRRAEAGEGSRP